MCDTRLLIPALITIGLSVLSAASWATRAGPASPTFARGNITCERPIKLAHDCSIWHGATRPIAFGRYRMHVAAGSDGRTILVARLRPRPDHNRHAFRPSVSMRSAGASAIRLIGSALEDQGIRLEHLQPLARGQRIDGWYLQFSGNAYDYLKQFTVLESEYWLPAAGN